MLNLLRARRQAVREQTRHCQVQNGRLVRQQSFLAAHKLKLWLPGQFISDGLNRRHRMNDWVGGNRLDYRHNLRNTTMAYE